VLCRCSSRSPAERVICEEAGQWRDDLAVGADKLAIIAGQSQEPVDRAHCAGQWPGPNGLHLVGVHGEEQGNPEPIWPGSILA
jgi:hypothetical protein